MKKERKSKNNDLIALRFKEVREKDFHEGIMKEGKRSDNTQMDFAEYLGVTPQTIGNYESGRTPVPEKYLRKLSDKYGILMEYLLGESDFRTLKDKREAINKQQWEKRVLTPIEIDGLVCNILEKMGYTEFEDNVTRKEFLTAEFEMPVGYDYTIHCIPQEELTKSFDGTACHIHPQEYCGIRREKDGKAKYILKSKLSAMYDDIENYIKYRIEREFR